MTIKYFVTDSEKHKITKLQSRIGESLSDVNATYQNAKAYCNRYERMCRKYRLPPSQATFDKKYGILGYRLN